MNAHPSSPTSTSRSRVAIPDVFETGQITERARAVNPGLEIIVRAHSDAEVEHLRARGASLIIMGEREIARGMIEHVLGKSEPAAVPASPRADDAGEAGRAIQGRSIGAPGRAT